MLMPALLLLAACAVGDDAAMKHHEGPMSKVQEASKAASRPVLLDFYTDW